MRLGQIGLVVCVATHVTALGAADYRIRPVLLSAYVTDPQIISISLISGFTMDRHAADQAKGFFGELEPGAAGGKLALGYGFFGPHGMHWYWKGALLRTWSDPWVVGANQTYVGPEAAVGDFGLSFRLGVYREVSGGPDDWLLSGAVGILFN